MSCIKCPASEVVDPPRVVFRDFFHPQLVEVIHPIEIVNRHHCVPVPHHRVIVSVRDIFCPGLGPAPVLTAQIKSVKKKKKTR